MEEQPTPHNRQNQAPADANRGPHHDVERPPKLSHGLPAWLLSVSLHAALLVVLGCMVRVAHRGAQLEPGRGGGIVLARDVEGASQYFGEGDASGDQQSQVEATESAAQGALPNSQELPIGLSETLPDASAALSADRVANALPSAAGFTADAAVSRGRVDGNQAHTSVFGAEGIGNKFVYVFDRSASMDGYQGRPLRAAKAELILSLQDLDVVHQFQIIFYNEHPTVFNPYRPHPPRMLFGESQWKRLAQNFVRGVIAAGGTSHLEAIELALGMNPDVIFFLTDAAEPQLSPSQLDRIRRKNSRVGATINAIEFGAGPNQGGMNFLVQLAHQNNGHHVYVDITRLPLN